MALNPNIPLATRNIDLASLVQSANRAKQQDLNIAAGERQNALLNLITPEEEAQAIRQDREIGARERRFQLSATQQQAVLSTAAAASQMRDPEAIRSLLNTARGFAEGNEAMTGLLDRGVSILDEGGVEAFRQAVAPIVQQSSGQKQPASVQEFQFFEQLSPDQQNTFRSLQRKGFQMVKDPAGGVQFINPDTGQQFQALSPDQAQELSARKAREDADASAQGKGEQTRRQDNITRGLDAADSVPTLRRGVSLLQTLQTGGVDAVALRAKQLFGLESADEAELASGLGKAVLSQLRETFGAQFTEREGARLESIEASIGKSTEGNIRLLQNAMTLMERVARRGIREAERNGDQESADEIRDALEFVLVPGQSDEDVIEVDGFQVRVKQ